MRQFERVQSCFKQETVPFLCSKDYKVTRKDVLLKENAYSMSIWIYLMTNSKRY